jgi:hypothetical protein
VESPACFPFFLDERDVVSLGLPGTSEVRRYHVLRDEFRAYLTDVLTHPFFCAFFDVHYAFPPAVTMAYTMTLINTMADTV